MSKKTIFFITLSCAVFSFSCKTCLKKETKKKVYSKKPGAVKTYKRLPRQTIEKAGLKEKSVKKHYISTQPVVNNESFCKTLNRKFIRYRWNKIICNPDRWKVYGHTLQGNPLFYQKFGFNKASDDVPVNLFICGVHGNEPTGVYFCFHLVRDIIFDNPHALDGFKLVVAPVVKPDGFLAGTRGNSRGVDPNRNLPTKDWRKNAMLVWKKYKNAPGKYPGKSPGSEIESKFQVFLLSKFKPDKIISVHAPYNFVDFDGPGDRKYYNLVRVEQRAKFLALNIEANSGKFLKVVDFRFFPGSLGN